MTATFLDTLTYAIIRFALIEFAAIFCISLLLIHCSQYIKHGIKNTLQQKQQQNEQMQKKMKLQKQIGILTIIMIFLFAISPILIAISETLIFLNIKQPSDRLIFIQIAVCFFRGGKGSLYVIFTIKLHLLYGGTSYAYKAITLRIFGTLIVLSTIIWIIVLPETIQMDYKQYSIYWSDDKYNTIYQFRTYFDKMVIVPGAVNELIAWSVLIYAFLRPLRKLLKSVSVDNESSKEFKLLAIKTTVLTFSAVLSSLFSYCFVIGFKISIITNCFDMPFNCICIMLMSPFYEKTYNRVCCGVIECFNYWNKRRDEQKATEIVRASTNSTQDATKTGVDSIEIHVKELNVSNL